MFADSGKKSLTEGSSDSELQASVSTFIAEIFKEREEMCSGEFQTTYTAQL